MAQTYRNETNETLLGVCDTCLIFNKIGQIGRPPQNPNKAKNLDGDDFNVSYNTQHVSHIIDFSQYVLSRDLGFLDKLDFRVVI